MLVTGVILVRPVDSAPMKLKMKAKIMLTIVTPTFCLYCRPRTRQEKNIERRRPPPHIHIGTAN